MTEVESPAVERRSVLQGAAVAVVAGAAGFTAYGAARPSSPTAAPAAQPAGGAAGTPLAALADVPAGGGVVLPDARLVLTRDGDDVRAFSAVCTHQGCLVSGVSGGLIVCPCHASAFDAATGAVVAGPATAPLPAVAVSVRDGSVVEGGS